MGWKHYQTVGPRKREPQVARGLFGIRLLILLFQIHQFNLYFEKKNISFPKNLHKTAKQWLMK